ncbi:MAG: TonB-dependent receptor plug domain-containing protein [Desulfobacterales bacterium]|nr:TonB-dependent receptor plug domain-containing protein [Desulfobacterales bacterium]
MKMCYQFLIIFLCIFLSEINGFSKLQDELSQKALENIEKEAEYMEAEMIDERDVITAGRRVQKLIKAPSAISIVTNEDIRLSGAVQLTEALRQLPGVNLGYTSVTQMPLGGIRGVSKLPTNKIMFLIDGVPWLNDAYRIGYYNMLPFSLDQIERVEVLRGAGSSLYGANAMFGVINVILKKPEDNQGSFSSFIAGEGETHIANTMYGGHIQKDLFYNLSAGYENQDNGDYIAWKADPMRRLFRVNSNFTWNVKEDASLSFWAAYLYPKSMDNILESTGPMDFSGGATYCASVMYNAYNPNIIIKGYAKNMEENKGWSLGKKELSFSSQGVRGIDMQHEFEPIANDIVVWGGNVESEYSESAAIGGKRTHNMLGLFLDNTYDFFNVFGSYDNEFSINTGIRYDKHPNTGTFFSHRLSGIFSFLGKQNIRFTWGRSYRTPDFVENYYDRFSIYKQGNSQAGIPDIYLHIYGQEDNRVEQAVSYEIGYHNQCTRNWFFNINFFNTKIKDFVYFASQKENMYVDPEIGGLVIPTPFINIGDAVQDGLEFETEYQFTAYLKGKFNYTYIEQKEKADKVKELLIMTPKHMANAELRAKFKNGWSTNISLYFKDRTIWREYTWASPLKDTRAGGTAAGYGILNIRIGYEFNLYDTNSEIAIFAFNLLDKRYDDYPMDTSDIGRRITAHLSFAF